MRTDYRLASAIVARTMGALLVLIGILFLLLTAAVLVLELPTVVLGVAGGAVLVAVGASALLFSRRPVVVTMDATGYRVRLVRGVGVDRARWTDVEDVVASTVAGERCVVLRLRDGRTTTVPVRMLQVDADVFARELQQQLNAGHGYRRIT